MMETEENRKSPSAISLGLAGCHVCGKVSPVSLGKCPRCGSSLHLRKVDSIRRTMAFVLASIVMYIPSNLLPILSARELGILTESTIIEGMIEFWQAGSYPIAIVIFSASILIPLLKMLALLILCAAASGVPRFSARSLSKLYWITEILGRWSMVDIFVVAILVTMVQLGNYMTITPGPAAFAFASMVILTMFAASSFDPKLIWDRFEQETTKPKVSS